MKNPKIKTAGRKKLLVLGKSDLSSLLLATSKEPISVLIVVKF